MGLRQPDDSHKVVTLNTAEPYTNQKGETEHYPVGEGDHDVTVSTGPGPAAGRRFDVAGDRPSAPDGHGQAQQPQAGE